MIRIRDAYKITETSNYDVLGLQLLLKTTLLHFSHQKGFMDISRQNSKLYKFSFNNFHCHW